MLLAQVADGNHGLWLRPLCRPDAVPPTARAVKELRQQLQDAQQDLDAECHAHAESRQALAAERCKQEAAAAPLQPCVDAAAVLNAADAFARQQADVDAVVAMQTATTQLQSAFSAFACSAVMQRVHDAEQAVLAAAPGQAMDEAAANRDGVTQQAVQQLKPALPVGTQLLQQLAREHAGLQPLCSVGIVVGGGDVGPAAVEEQRQRVQSARQKAIDAFAALAKHHGTIADLWAKAATSARTMQQQVAIVAARARQTLLEDQLQRANSDLQAASTTLQQRIDGAEQSLARRLATRWAAVQELNCSAHADVDALRTELDRLDSVLAAGVGKADAVRAVQEALDTLEEAREDLSHAHNKAKRNRITADQLASAEQAVAAARASYNDAARKLLRIAAAGHPEVQLGAVTRHQQLLPNVPTISAAQLTAMGEPDDSNVLGSGAVSSVHQLTLASGPVAFKRFNASVGQAEVRREANAMWQLRHPNIVQLLMACLDGDHVGLVLELMERSLHAVLHQQKRALPTATVLLYLRDVAAAVTYLHAHNTMHLDLKSANVLLRGGVAKIADFGTTKAVRDTIHMTKVALTPNWCAPEYLRDPQAPQPAADVWSVGMVLYEMCTNSVPYERSADKQQQQQAWQVLGRIRDGELPLLPTTVDAQCAQWMDECWLPAPTRITAKQLYDDVAAALMQECQVCFAPFLLNRGGVQCASLRHLRCTACLQDELEQALGEARTQPDTSLPCTACNSVGFQSRFAADSFRDLVPLALWDRWHRACTEQNYRATEQAERERRRNMTTVERKVDRIQRKILNLACPHCDTPAVYAGGCLALTCLAPACDWKFCAYCLQSFRPNEGGAAHDHVAECAHNPRQPHIHPPGAASSHADYFATVVDRLRIKHLLVAQLQRIQPRELRNAVRAKLAPDLQRLNVVIDEGKISMETTGTRLPVPMLTHAKQARGLVGVVLDDYNQAPQGDAEFLRMLREESEHAH